MNNSFKVPNDHNIYSALNTGKVSDSALTELFLSRGILISPKTDKEQRAFYFSSFIHGFKDYELISSQHAKGSRTEFTTSAKVEGDIEFSNVLAACEAFEETVDKLYQNTQITQIDVETLNEHKINLKVNYQRFHPDKQMFSQFEPKVAVIEINVTDDKLYIESPSTPEAYEWLDLLITSVSQEDEKSKVNLIDLTYLTDPDEYWNFFNNLTSNLPGYERVDVLEVVLKKPKVADDSDDSDEEESALTYRIDSASYKGKQLHRAEEFKLKISEGFQLNKFSWDCKEKGNINSDIFKLCVKLNDSKNKKILSFISKGFVKYNIEKGEHLKNSQSLPRSVEKKFNKIIFEAALSLLNPPTASLINKTDDSA
ncbi:hypothetical protein [Acinetobacter sp. 'aerobic (ED)']|uniref:hypothetical protein n=1 Tax=Acinetobacter sp. 'aerobic (ED)' TaxID=174230 RepID=UPI00192AE60B|nr:hypothetical protein [Acinetobacter sp. 'aerobic (ED)']